MIDCKFTIIIREFLISYQLEVEIPVWSYITNLKALETTVCQSKDAAVLILEQALYQSVSNELELLGSHVCPACNGWGHSREKCPTWAKLGHLGSLGTHGA